jgi:chlorite dismutase
MSKPIYKLWLARPKEAWFELSKEERQQLLAQHEERFQQTDAKEIIFCDASWSTDEWQWCGVEEFADLDAVQKHARDLRELNWSRYFDGISVLGTKPGNDT